jgi:polyhydroxyalkanoate synthase
MKTKKPAPAGKKRAPAPKGRSGPGKAVAARKAPAAAKPAAPALPVAAPAPPAAASAPRKPGNGLGPAPVARLAEDLDRILHSEVAKFTGGLSPIGLYQAWSDWAAHLAAAPGRRALLAAEAARDYARLAAYAAKSIASGGKEPPVVEPLPQDRRFSSEGWQRWPFNILHQAFLLQERWWHRATTGLRGVTSRHERLTEFAARQVLDTMAPSNFILTNPDILERTLSTGGRNLLAGLNNLVEDWQRQTAGKKPVGAEKFVVGKTLAVTPGKVVWRNRLMELIQYAPATAEVKPEPLLIVPAWIMKYYILDLSPGNSLVRYLVGQGFTVFMISWKNPDTGDSDLSFDDYRRLGVGTALDVVGRIVPGARIHALGYCLGGTLLAIAAAAMARDGDTRLASMGLLAAQTDFTEPGELELFISASELALLDDMMWRQGYLDDEQMAWAFRLLRSNDLIWSRLVTEYLMGERQGMNDLMAWNADSTRLPYRMHSEYLRRLFLHNDLAEGRIMVGGRPVALSDIRAPIFAVGTLRDHVAPWRSAFKIHLLTDTEVTFLLTSGGHNAGIVSEPGHRGRTYQMATRPADGAYVDPDRWADSEPRREGSWWPEYAAWLAARSGRPVKPPAIGGGVLAPLGDAPGTYVLAG